MATGTPSFAGKGLAGFISDKMDLGGSEARNSRAQGKSYLLNVIRQKINDPNYPAQLKDNLSRLYEGISNGTVDDQQAMAHVNRINQKYQEIQAGTRGPGHARAGGMGVEGPDGLGSGLGPGGEEDAPYTGPNYVEMLKEQMGRARGSVESSFGAALAQIAAAEAATGQAAAAAPGVINERYAQAQANQNTNAAALFEATQKAGLGQFAQPTQDATMAPLQQALTLDQTAALQGVDFTKMGLAQYYAQQRADNEREKAAQLADLSQQESSLMLDAYQQEADRQEAARQALSEGKGVIPAFGQHDVSQARGGAILASAQNPDLFKQGLTQYDPGMADQLRETPTYQRATKKLGKAVAVQGKNPKRAKKIVKKITTGRRFTGHAKATSVALADNPSLLAYFQPKG